MPSCQRVHLRYVIGNHGLARAPAGEDEPASAGVDDVEGHAAAARLIAGRDVCILRHPRGRLRKRAAMRFILSTDEPAKESRRIARRRK